MVKQPGGSGGAGGNPLRAVGVVAGGRAPMSLGAGGLLALLVTACAQFSGAPAGTGTGGSSPADAGGSGGGSTGTGASSTGTGAGGRGAASGGRGSGSGGAVGGTGGSTGSGGAGISGTGGGVQGPTTKVDLKGKKVLFIVDDPASLSEGDAMLRDHMAVGRDMVVTLANTTAADATAATMNLIVASSSASASELAALYKSIAVPMIVFGNSAYQALGFIATSSGKGTTSTPVMLSVIDGATPLAAALPMGTSFSAIGTARSTSVYWGTPAGSPIKVAAVAATPAQLVVFAYERGAAMAADSAPARRVGLGFRSDVIGDLSIESFKLMNAALDWTAGGGQP